MAEFLFYGTWSDSLTCLQAIAELDQFTFTVDMPYAEPAVLHFHALSEELISLVQEPDVCIFLPSKEDSSFRPQFVTGRGRWRISEISSGPALLLSFPLCLQVEETLHLSDGALSYLNHYRNPETGEWYKAPEALRQDYRLLRSRLRKTMEKRTIQSEIVSNGVFKPVIEPLWIGPDALHLLESGLAEIRVNGEWRSGKEVLP